MQIIRCGFCKNKYKNLDTADCRKCVSKYKVLIGDGHVDNFEFECPVCSTQELPQEGKCSCSFGIPGELLEKRKPY